MNKKNTPFAESIMNCGATFLNPDTTPSLCYKAAKQFVDAYEHEQRHEAQERKWSSKKQRAYGKLLDCAIGRMSPETICDAAIELAQACKSEREEPKVGDVYRDIFGNSYIVFDVLETVDGDPLVTPAIVLARVNDKGVPLMGSLRSPTLEDFMNPTFKKI